MTQTPYRPKPHPTTADAIHSLPGDPSPVLTVHVARPETGLSVVCPVGDVDISTAPLLQSRIDEEIDTGCDRLQLALDAVRFFDARGVSCLVRTDLAAARHRIAFALLAPSPAVTRTLRVCRLDQRFPIERSVIPATSYVAARER